MLTWASDPPKKFAFPSCHSKEMLEFILCGWYPLLALTAFPMNVIATQHFMAILTEIPFQTDFRYLLFLCRKCRFFLTSI